MTDLTPKLDPLKHSHEHDQYEAECRALFMAVFEDLLRALERDSNVVGMPHLGSFDLVSRFVKEDGLALINNDDDNAMRYLHKAWAGRNPRQGIHFLRTYLQLLWPNLNSVYQMWHPKADASIYPEKVTYPYTITDDPEKDYFLTNRVVAFIEFAGDPEERELVEPALRSILGAEYVLSLNSLTHTQHRVTMATGFAVKQVINLDVCFEEARLA